MGFFLEEGGFGFFYLFVCFALLVFGFFVCGFGFFKLLLGLFACWGVLFVCFGFFCYHIPSLLTLLGIAN